MRYYYSIIVILVFLTSSMACGQTVIEKHVFNAAGADTIIGNIAYTSSFGEPVAGAANIFEGFLYEYADITIGINDPSPVHASVGFFPNPFTGILNLTSSVQMARMDLYNALGQIAYSTPLSGSSITISIQPLPAGVYFILVFDGEGKCIYQEKALRGNDYR